MSLYKKRPRRDLKEAGDIATLLAMLIVASILLAILVRIQRGLLGIVLGCLAVALAAYWILELRRALRGDLKIRLQDTKGWNSDIIEDANEILVVGNVPGPEDKIEIRLHDDLLEVKGGRGFHELVRLPSKVVGFTRAYNNGVLEVRLKKAQQ
ncbi:MAG: Hsp20/alpha crystallin family protein [Candidatus Bathyarchaeia archaeon]